jgi:predicted HicB family RNase H-like nuclease
MSQTLQYKGYDGSVLYSAEDRVLHGRILGIRDMAPNIPFKGSFNVRLPQELHHKAALYAEEHDLKLNAVVQEALQEFLTHAD